MKYEANIYQTQVEDHVFWVAESKVLKGCVGQGDSSQDAISELESNEEEWLDTALEVGIPIPEPTAKVLAIPTGKFALRLSPNVYSDSCEISKDLGVSLNQHFCNAIVAYNVTCKSFLHQPIIHEEFSPKVVSFPVPLSAHKAPSIECIEEPEEM